MTDRPPLPPHPRRNQGSSQQYLATHRSTGFNPIAPGYMASTESSPIQPVPPGAPGPMGAQGPPNPFALNAPIPFPPLSEERKKELKKRSKSLQTQRSKEVARLSEQIQPRGGAKKTHVYNGKTYTIQTGARGGRYIVVGVERRRVYV